MAVCPPSITSIFPHDNYLHKVSTIILKQLLLRCVFSMVLCSLSRSNRYLKNSIGNFSFKTTAAKGVAYNNFFQNDTNQKQTFAAVLQNRFRKFHRKTPVLESLFNKVAGLSPATVLKRDPNTSAFL